MIIQTENLRKSFGRHGALNGLNSVGARRQRLVPAIGANGAGKTTTILGC